MSAGAYRHGRCRSSTQRHVLDLVIGQIQDTDGLACARPVPDLPVNKG